MTQDKVSKYKRVVMFLIGIVILGANTAIFGYVWYQFYSDAILLPFYRRGNWLVVGIYLVIHRPWRCYSLTRSPMLRSA